MKNNNLKKNIKKKNQRRKINYIEIIFKKWYKNELKLNYLRNNQLVIKLKLSRC